MRGATPVRGPWASRLRWGEQLSSPAAWWAAGVVLCFVWSFVNCHMFGRHDRKGGRAVPFVESQFLLPTSPTRAASKVSEMADV